MDKPRTMPKDFFLWAGAMLALYVGVFNFIGLLWDYINYAYPNPLAYYPADPYESGISWEMATLIVLTPLFLLLMWLIHRGIAADASRRDIWIRRWALYLTLFAAGAAMAIDLIYVLYAFLNGTDLTTSFLLKALIVLLVAAIGFMHFIADLWGYWEQFPARQRSVSIGTAVLVILAIVAGFFIVGTPMQARAYRFDAQKISDLQQIQSQVVYYWRQTGKLPSALSDLNDSLSNYQLPVDPQTGAAYTYILAGTHSFKLCATFNFDSAGRNLAPVAEVTAPMAPALPSAQINDNWQYGAGTTCFLRTIDPALYPPQKNTK